MKKELMRALLGDDVLVSLVGRLSSSDKPCIFFNTPLCENNFPAVAFFESGGGDAVFADDRCIAGTVCMQADIWAESGLTAIYERVDGILRGLGYFRESFRDLPEASVGHVQMVYKKYVFDD